jgi:antitoxin component of MazEF toxin-antitoxin module
MRDYVSRMQLSLRKMGNSVGVIIPAVVLKQVGAGAGTAIDCSVEEGKVVLAPRRDPREGWAEDAARIGALPLTEEERDWMAFGNEGDDELVW